MRKREKAVLTLAALILTLPLGILGIVPVNAQEPAGSVEFRHGEGVSEQYQIEIEEGVYLARDYLFQAWNMMLDRQVVVETFATDGMPGDAGGNAIGFSTGSPVWIDTTARQRIKIAVHEYLHLAQHQLGMTPETPIWIVEGSAEYMALSAIVSRGLVSAEDITAFHTYNVAYAPGMATLRDMEQIWDFSTGPVYSVAALAVEQLVLQSGVRSIRTFFELVGEEQTNADAFHTAFNQDMDTFYNEFESIRANLVAPGNPPASLLPPGPMQEYAAGVTLLQGPDSGRGGEQTVLIAATAPSVRCTLDLLATPEGPIVDTRETQADLVGIAVWLWTVQPATTGDIGALSVACGSTPVTFPFQTE